MASWKTPPPTDKQKEELDAILLEEEAVVLYFPLAVDYVVLTNRRVLFVDKSISSTETTINSIPLSRISSVHLAKGGFLKFTKSVYIRVSSESYKITFLFEKNAAEFFNKVNASL